MENKKLVERRNDWSVNLLEVRNIYRTKTQPHVYQITFSSLSSGKVRGTCMGFLAQTYADDKALKAASPVGF